MKKSIIALSLIATTNFAYADYSGIADTAAMQKCDTAGNVCVNTFNHNGDTRANNQGTVAIGQAVIVDGLNATAIGSGTVANGGSTVVIGTEAFSGERATVSIVIGERATTEESGVVLIGSQSTTSGSGHIAIGRGIASTGSAGISIGNGAAANAKYATAIQVQSKAEAIQGLAIGRGTHVTENAVYGNAIGSGAKSDAESATAIGTLSEALGKESYALGAYAKAKEAGGVALGSYSVSQTAKGAAGSNPLNAPIDVTTPTWTSTATDVAVGDVDNGLTRQITSVAAGTKDTDAVNVAQLAATGKAAKTEVNAGENVSVVNVPGKDGQNVYTVSAKDTTATVSSKTDLVTVTKGKEAKVGTANVTDYAVDLSDTAKEGISRGLTAVQTVKAGQNTTVTQNGDVVTVNAKDTQVVAGSNAVTVNSVTTGLNTVATVDVSAKTKASLAKADTALQNVVAGENVTVAKNGNTVTVSAKDSKSVVVGKGEVVVNFSADGDTTTYEVELADTVRNDINTAINQSNTALANTAKVDGKVEALKGDVHNNKRDARAGIAGVAAMANLLQPVYAGQGVVTAGVGYHKGESAIAIGAGKMTDNGRWAVRGSVSFDTRKNFTAGAAVGYFW